MWTQAAAYLFAQSRWTRGRHDRLRTWVPPRLLRRARIPRPTLLRHFEAPAAFGTASCCCPRGVLPRLAQDAHIPLAPRHLFFVEMFHQSQRILATGLEHIAYLGNGDATLFMDDFDDARDHFLVSLCEK